MGGVVAKKTDGNSHIPLNYRLSKNCWNFLVGIFFLLNNFRPEMQNINVELRKKTFFLKKNKIER